MPTTNPDKPKKAKIPVNPESKRRSKLAKFIVEKYVLKRDINWPRDMKIAVRMVSEFPENRFWEGLPVKFQSPSLVCLNTEKARAFLLRSWQEFNLVLPTPECYDYVGLKQGDDYVPTEKKPLLSLLDFSKQHEQKTS